MRIASLAPSATIMLQELGAAEQIVACTSLCPLPTGERRQKSVGTFSVLNEEKIAAARPDLVITATLVQEKGAARLRASGYHVLHLDPRRLVDIAATYVVLGEAVGRSSQGEEERKRFLANIEEINELPVLPSVRVYMEEWHQPPYVAGNWVPDIVKEAGGEAVLITAGQPSREITFEEIEAADPEAIIQHVCLPPWWVTPGGLDSPQRQAQRALFRQQLLAREGWQSLRAVHTGQVYVIDDSPFNMPTHGVLEGIKILREVLAKVRVQSRVR